MLAIVKTTTIAITSTTAVTAEYYPIISTTATASKSIANAKQKQSRATCSNSSSVS